MEKQKETLLKQAHWHFNRLRIKIQSLEGLKDLSELKKEIDSAEILGESQDFEKSMVYIWEMVQRCQKYITDVPPAPAPVPPAPPAPVLSGYDIISTAYELDHDMKRKLGSLISRGLESKSVNTSRTVATLDPHNLKEQLVDLAEKISTARSSRQNAIMMDAFETLNAEVDDQMAIYHAVWIAFIEVLSKYGWAKGCRVGFNTELSNVQCNNLSREIIGLSKIHFT